MENLGQQGHGNEYLIECDYIQGEIYHEGRMEEAAKLGRKTTVPVDRGYDVISPSGSRTPKNEGARNRTDEQKENAICL
jgi:hypothetical protein